MLLVRRVAVGAVATALTWSTLAAPEAASAQQRDFANPLASTDPADLAVERVHLDANAESVSVRLDARNVDIDGDGYLAAYAELASSPDAAVNDEITRLDAAIGENRWNVRGATMLKGSVRQLPSTAVSVSRVGGAITLQVKTSALGWSGPVYVNGGVITRRHVANAQASLDDRRLRIGPVATTPDPTRTTLSLSRASRTAGREPVTATVTTAPAVPGVVLVSDGTREIGRVTQRNGRATFVIPASLSIGTHTLRATFRPLDTARHASSASSATLRVLRPPARTTRTALRLSRTAMVRGRSKPARAAVVVSGRASGTVTLYDGRRRLRTLVLRHGVARYTFSRRLKVGVHRVKAVYRPADVRVHRPSASPVRRLKVTRR
ncbi:Ig-like domain repeat protein [Aeromicrobium massiliense]|uniref:Ig-like domain repeat protein n=1 Tax=Aeromicrobium massiliense TaxID=1464554 RepID=UPI0002EEB650|nr:Ig-like domain repeat protein [Aeromicrobium massiliense]